MALDVGMIHYNKVGFSVKKLIVTSGLNILWMKCATRKE